MTWIGLRDSHGGMLRPQGLDGPDMGPANPDTVLARGTLLIEFRHDPAGHPRNILRYSARDPWPAGLTLCLDPDGTLRLMLTQGRQALSYALPLAPLIAAEAVLVTFSWDAPARNGWLSAQLTDREALFQTALAAPLPLSLRDAGRIMGDDSTCRIAPGLVFAALADHILPAGPLPMLGAQSMISTPSGAQKVTALRPGMAVLTADGGTAKVRWAGSCDLPARGRFAPMLLRAPYHGLNRDLLLAADQRLQLGGSEVEYLFGEEQVAVPVRHLADNRAIWPAASGPVIRYHHLLLDRHAIILANGAAIESMDASLLTDPAMQAQSVLAGLTDPPRGPRLPWPVLRDFEALTLQRLRAA